MNWRDKIIADWPNDPQKAHRCVTALRDLDRILQELAGLGHGLHLVEGYEPPPPPGWPKAVFHILAGVRVVHCAADLEELGEDWYPTMEEARHAAGMRKQMQRGGIFSRAMPTLLTQTPDEIRKHLEEEIARKEAQRKMVGDMRTANRASFQASTYLIDHGGPEPEPTIQEVFGTMTVRRG